MDALVFDCDGVLADTERYGHLVAFNQLFREAGLPVLWSDEDYKRKLEIAGGKERIASLFSKDFVERAGLPRDPSAQKALIASWHTRKTAIFSELVAEGRIPPRKGVRRIADEAARHGVRLAVASTSAEKSVRQVLETVVGRELSREFLVLAGDVVPLKKPAPDIYLLALERLAARPRRTLVIEDSGNGLRAARAAGLEVLVTLSFYTRDEDMTEARLVLTDLGDPGEPMEIVKNRSRARPGPYLVLADLEACLED